MPQSVFDWYVKKRNSRSVVLESALREEHCILSGTIYRCLTDDIDRKKVRPEPLRARCALLLAGEKYSYTKIPVFDEGLLGCIKDLESHYFENALDKLLGVVHVDSDPFSLLCGLKNRAVAGNLKGARRLNERTEQETLELLDSRLQRNRYKKMALVERGIPVVTVNYHAAPVVAKRQANDFLGSLDAAN
ncbi:hypothetical protein [Thioalkalivibrio sp. ALJ7]|uniref:hypothetical protein n=1 Tax=Thioalkalivibrio sp. ALJ7 TaxID=1158756 RepID=UPI0012DDE362|nr:hypothetical protein [Thioalkalivibrio sp. ALJ7]